jgi:hypothetical protein
MKLVADEVPSGYRVERDEAGFRTFVAVIPRIAWAGSCDWGACRDEGVGFRRSRTRQAWSAQVGWVTVCRAHYDEEPDEERRVILRDALA